MQAEEVHSFQPCMLGALPLQALHVLGILRELVEEEHGGRTKHLTDEIL
jgi:hypothetical protein